jgi:hypothetical protein
MHANHNKDSLCDVPVLPGDKIGGLPGCCDDCGGDEFVLSLVEESKGIQIGRGDRSVVLDELAAETPILFCGTECLTTTSKRKNHCFGAR